MHGADVALRMAARCLISSFHWRPIATPRARKISATTSTARDVMTGEFISGLDAECSAHVAEPLIQPVQCHLRELVRVWRIAFVDTAEEDFCWAQ